MPESDIRRVLMTTDTVGGVWTFTLELAREFSRRGIEVGLAALGGHPSLEQLAEANAIPRLCLLSSHYKLEWMSEPWDDIARSGEWLLQLEREFQPDILHLNTFGHGSLAWKAPALLTAHSCVLSWWEAVKQEPAPRDWDRYQSLVTKSLHAATAVTAPTYAMAASLSRYYHLPPDCCRVIPNGRSSLHFQPKPKEPFILSAGRIWDDAKNIAALATVAPSLPWPVYLAGETHHPDGGTAKPDSCHVLGRLTTPELSDWMSRASIFALPARYEPFGLSILEAGLSACALVLGDVSSLREVWGDAALYVAPPNDPDGLIRALRLVIEDAPLRDEMSRRSYQRALTFTPENTAQLYLKAYTNSGRLACAL